MRITIVTVGSRGDVEPYIALGLGLRHAGHGVSLATHANFETTILSRGLGFFNLVGNPRELLESGEGQDWLKSGTNPLAFIDKLSKIAGPMVKQMVRDCLIACRGADAIIYSPLGGLAAYHVVEKLGLPFLPAFLQPASPTSAFPAPAFPTSIRLGGFFNRLTYTFSEQLLWYMMGKPMNQARQEVLGLRPLAKAWYAEGHKLRIPILYGYSPSVIPTPPDWGDWPHVTGYWFLAPPDDWEPPSDLVDFLASGPPPVYFGFGSMKDTEQRKITDIVLKALAMAKCRGIIATGWGGLSGTDLPHDVFKIQEIPHRWLFPQVAAVVHHAGAGTTAAGIRAGVPTVAVPFFADQPFWAHRVFKLGAGPKPLPRKKLSAELLAERIRSALDDAGMRARAAELGERVRAENGVARAVEVFNRLINR